MNMWILNRIWSNSSMFETLLLENARLLFVCSFPSLPQGGPATILHPSNDFHWVSKVFFSLSVSFLSLKTRIMRSFPGDVLTQCVLKSTGTGCEAVSKQPLQSTEFSSRPSLVSYFKILLKDFIRTDVGPVSWWFTDKVYLYSIFNKCYLKNSELIPDHFLPSCLLW